MFYCFVVGINLNSPLKAVRLKTCNRVAAELFNITITTGSSYCCKRDCYTEYTEDRQSIQSLRKIDKVYRR